MSEVRNCDCGSTSIAVDIFAGVSCEHKATSLCTTPTQESFCVNGGQCQENNSCKCDSPWQGIHCEFPVAPKDLPNFYDDSINDLTDNDNSAIECNLICMNGGTCAQGAKDLGFLRDTVGDVAHLNQTHADDQFAHCVCTDGWVGLTCEQKIEVCGKEQHICLHGSKCNLDPNIDRGYSCDCSKADDTVGDNEIHVFAGDSCQYTDTDICTIGDDYPGRPLYFCVNGGGCNAWVVGNELDPGCTCTDDYAGPHCEINIDRSSAVDKKRKRASASKSNNAGMIIGTLLGLLAVLALLAIGVRFWMVRKERPAATKDIPANRGTSFPRRRRRRSGFGGSPNLHLNPRSPIANTDLPPSSDIDSVVDHNDGIMNDGLEDKSEPYLDDPVLVESHSHDDGRQLHGSDFVQKQENTKKGAK